MTIRVVHIGDPASDRLSAPPRQAALPGGARVRRAGFLVAAAALIALSVGVAAGTAGGSMGVSPARPAAAVEASPGAVPTAPRAEPGWP